MKIGAVSNKSGLSVDTLRYYEKIGLIAKPARDRCGHRDYSQDILVWLEFLGRLKSTGMSLKDCLSYATLRQQGEATRAQRCRLLEDHYTKVLAQRDMLSQTLEILAAKMASYRSVQLKLDRDNEHPHHHITTTL